MNNLLKYISFTKNETKIILFTVTVLAAGFSIKYYKHVTGSDSETSYDFSKSDAEFKERSNNAKRNKLPPGDIDTSVDDENDLSKKLQASDDSLNTNKESSGLLSKSININIATKNELIDLPGVGESIADKIINYRDEEKGFRKIEDLMKVKGIGKKKFEKIKEYIKVE
jgi:competence protein ComEA